MHILHLYDSEIWSGFLEEVVASEGKILNSNDLYMANQTSGLIAPDKYDLITEYVEAITDLV